jgi:hypothetical protein
VKKSWHNLAGNRFAPNSQGFLNGLDETLAAE